MLFLALKHGRESTEEDMNGWGFDGPVLGPLECVHTTYAWRVFIGDRYKELIVVDDCLRYKGRFYGDWTVITESEIINRGYTPEEPEGNDD